MRIVGGGGMGLQAVWHLDTRLKNYVATLQCKVSNASFATVQLCDNEPTIRVPRPVTDQSSVSGT